MTDPTNPGSPWIPPQPPQPPPPGPTQAPPAGPAEPTPGWQPPSTGWPAQPPPGYPVAVPPPSRRGRWIRLAVVLGIVAIIGGGFVLLRDRLSNDVASLQPGECFDQPPADLTTVTDVQRQPCNELHDAEVFANVVHTGASGSTWPPTSEFDDLASEECIPRLQTYTGLSVDQMVERDLNYGYFYPSSESWGDGDRTVTCYVFNSDRTKARGSLRNVGGATASP